MTKIKRSASTTTSAFLALSCVGFIASAPAHANLRDDDDITAQQKRERRDDIVVTGTAEDLKQDSIKATRTVRDTPQTVTVINSKTIQEQNLLTLRDVLATVPGITFGAGEGGGGYGDSINLRGFSANTDITVDGVRDSAQYSRTDPFNLEQIEVVSGANSVNSGSGSVGGSINIVTKRPTADTRTTVSAGIGTDDYYRGTIDSNIRVAGNVAFRLNAMIHENRVPGRDVEDYKRWGIAPALTIGIDGPTRLIVQYLHQEDTNIPQYGVPYYQVAGGVLPGVDTSDYFGYRNVDTQEINIDQFTVTLEHDFSDTVTIRNLTRWQDVTQFAIVNPPQGTFCLASGLTPTGGACTATIATQAIGTTSVPGGTALGAGKVAFQIGAAAPYTMSLSSVGTGAARSLAVTAVTTASTGMTTAALQTGADAETAQIAVGTYVPGTIAAGDTLSFDFQVSGTTYRATHSFSSEPASASAFEAAIQSAINGATSVPGGAPLGAGTVGIDVDAAGNISLSTTVPGARTLTLDSVTAVAGGNGDSSKTGGLQAASEKPDVTGLANLLRLGAGVAADPTKIRDGVVFDYNAANSGGFTARLNELGNALTANRAFSETSGADPSASIADYAASSVSWLQANRQEYLSETEYKTTLLEQTQKALSNETGINMDEQLTKLIEIERSYQASSKLISTIDEMLQTLLNSI